MSVDNKITSRNIGIDYLRFIGLSLIILAHVSPPKLLFHFRCFDVCLMLFVSGLAYSGRLPEFSINFLWHRFKRLIFPVYIFLTVYFALVIVAESLGFHIGFKKEYILGSYLLTGGIGYVWIIRVFLMITILTPILQKVERVLKNTMLLISILLAITILTDFLIRNHIGTDNYFINKYFYYAIGYSILFILGLRVKKTLLPSILCIMGIICTVVLAYIVVVGGDYWLINNFKYPPQFYYLAYGSIASITLYIVLCYNKQLRANSKCLFIAQNSIWIYLYHIPFVQYASHTSLDWYIKFPIVYISAITICYLQIRIIEWLSRKYGERNIFKYLKG